MQGKMVDVCRYSLFLSSLLLFLAVFSSLSLMLSQYVSNLSAKFHIQPFVCVRAFAFCHTTRSLCAFMEVSVYFLSTRIFYFIWLALSRTYLAIVLFLIHRHHRASIQSLVDHPSNLSNFFFSPLLLFMFSLHFFLTSTNNTDPQYLALQLVLIGSLSMKSLLFRAGLVPVQQIHTSSVARAEAGNGELKMVKQSVSTREGQAIFIFSFAKIPALLTSHPFPM